MLFKFISILNYWQPNVILHSTFVWKIRTECLQCGLKLTMSLRNSFYWSLMKKSFTQIDFFRRFKHVGDAITFEPFNWLNHYNKWTFRQRVKRTNYNSSKLYPFTNYWWPFKVQHKMDEKEWKTEKKNCVEHRNAVKANKFGRRC